MLAILKRISFLMAVGGVLGDVTAMLLAPSFLTWFHSPGTGSALCNCTDVARETAEALIETQLASTVLGALFLAIVGELSFRLWHARKGRAPTSPPTS